MNRVSSRVWVLSVLLGLCALTSRTRAEDVTPAHFHHVMINSVDPAESIRFYARVFGATPMHVRCRRRDSGADGRAAPVPLQEFPGTGASGMSVEIVEAKPIPEGTWDSD